MVTVENLSKTFGTDTEVLKDINLNIRKNEIVAILGPSGTGKSTLLRCLNFLCVPTTGIIQIGNARVNAASYTSKEVRNLRRQSAMVFQGYNLFKNRKPLENANGSSRNSAEQTKGGSRGNFLTAFREGGTLDRKDFYPAKMSGGQQQRSCQGPGSIIRTFCLTNPLRPDPEPVEKY
ncbi:MAG: ATP-binding cassette domain-containing protein [Enterocloster sp.]